MPTQTRRLSQRRRRERDCEARAAPFAVDSKQFWTDQSRSWRDTHFVFVNAHAAVIADNKILIRAERYRPDVPRHALGHVGFFKGLAVNVQDALLQFKLLAGEPD